MIHDDDVSFAGFLRISHLVWTGFVSQCQTSRNNLASSFEKDVRAAMQSLGSVVSVGRLTSTFGRIVWGKVSHTFEYCIRNMLEPAQERTWKNMKEPTKRSETCSLWMLQKVLRAFDPRHVLVEHVGSHNLSMTRVNVLDHILAYSFYRRVLFNPFYILEFHLLEETSVHPDHEKWVKWVVEPSPARDKGSSGWIGELTEFRMPVICIGRTEAKHKDRMSSTSPRRALVTRCH